MQQKLREYQQKQLYRERKIRPAGLCFSNNDYLNLAKDPRVINALCEGAYQYGLGSTGSALISGYSKAHARFEQAFAKYVKRDRALLFSSGYMANVAVLQALLNDQDTVFQDKLNHASMLDGARLSQAKLKRYRHLEVDHLQSILAQASSGEKIICTDHVFSMTGEIAPLADLIKTATRYHAHLMIDAAHSLGVFDFPYTQTEIPLLICPLGKAFGGSGAVVAGSHILIETLIQFARTYMFSTALSPAVTHAMSTSLKLIQTESWRREKLFENIRYFKNAATEKNIPLKPSATGIQMIHIGDNLRVQHIRETLFAKRIFVGAVRPPSVPIGQAALRITVSTKHEKPEIDFLLDQLSCLL